MDHVFSWTDIWVALHSMAHSFMELDKSVIHVISLVSFLWLVFILSALWWMRIRGLWKLPDARDWLCGKLGVALVSKAKLSKSLIQTSANRWGCNLAWGQTTVGVMSTSFKKDLCQYVMAPRNAAVCAPDPTAGHFWLTPPPETPGHSQASVAQSFVGHCFFLLSPGVHKVLLYPARVCFWVLWKFCNQILLTFKVKFPWDTQFFCWISRLGNLLWVLEVL